MTQQEILSQVAGWRGIEGGTWVRLEGSQEPSRGIGCGVIKREKDDSRV